MIDAPPRAGSRQGAGYLQRAAGVRNVPPMEYHPSKPSEGTSSKNQEDASGTSKGSSAERENVSSSPAVLPDASGAPPARVGVHAPEMARQRRPDQWTAGSAAPGRAAAADAGGGSMPCFWIL